MVRKTRKQAKNEKAMTVLQLRKAFDHIDRYVKTKNPDVGSFCKEWKKTFGKEVSKEAAEDYLKFVMAKGKGKGQAGGAMTIAPAPLGYDMRAGADIPHGSFPDYVSGGFGFANNSSFSGTNQQVAFPSPPAGLGSNKVGGGKKTRKTKKQRKQAGGAGGFLQSAATITSEFFNRPFLVNPQSGNSQFPNYDMQMMAKGAQGPMGYPSPRPEIPTFSFNTNNANYAASISPASVRF
jgi:hypothetical protein